MGSWSDLGAELGSEALLHHDFTSVKTAVYVLDWPMVVSVAVCGSWVSIAYGSTINCELSAVTAELEVPCGGEMMMVPSDRYFEASVLEALV